MTAPTPAPTGGARTLVVGAGQAGLSLVSALRDLGDTGPITLSGSEPLPPYERPPLSKAYLRGEHHRDDLVVRPREWFAQHGIELRTSDPVVALERDARGGAATYASGEVVEFDRLALTTGARSRELAVPGHHLPGVLRLRGVADADRLASALAAGGPVVVVGGGFIGLEVAANARALGCAVTVVEVADRLMGRSVTPVVSDFFREWHEKQGTRVVLGERVDRLLGDGHVSGVSLASGEQLDAAVVVVGIGARPRTELADMLDLEVTEAGIVVDASARTSDGATVAAGDCTVGPNPYRLGVPGPTRLESVQHAMDQAATAAATLAGRPTAYEEMPWFWSDQGDLTLQIAGLTAGADRTVVRGEPSSEHFTVLSYREGVLVGAECVGAPVDYVAVKRGIQRGMTIDPDAAADAGVPLKRLLRRP